MKITIELHRLAAQKLRAEAQRLGVPIEELARTLLMAAVARDDAEFQGAAARVVAKNKDLCRRLV